MLLPHRIAEGPANMALDAAVLEHVAAAPVAAFLRTYGWLTPTLSLGYFQRLAEARGDSRWEGVPVVRRPTGGGAIWHDQELTYAVVLPATHPAARPSARLYQKVHGAILGVLREKGLDVNRRGLTEPAPDGGQRPFLCFRDRDPEDLVCGGTKIVGSAQRKCKGAILQHGSLLLGRSERIPELRGVSDLGAQPLDVAAWADAVAGAIAAALGFGPIEPGFPRELERRARELESQTYRDPAWTGRR